jgi:hypothetical protein
MKSGRMAQKVLNYELGLGRAPMIGANPLNIREVQKRIPGSVTPGTTLLPGMPGYSGSGGPQTVGGGAPRFRTLYKVGGQTFRNENKAQKYARENGQQGKRYQGFEASRDFQTGLRGGLDAIDASAAASGMGLSGRTLQAVNKFGTDYTMGYRDNYLNKLAGVAGNGQNAAAQRGNAGANFGAMAGNALGSIGNAQAAGAIGQANAWGNALGDAYGIWNYQRNLANGVG